MDSVPLGDPPIEEPPIEDSPTSSQPQSINHWERVVVESQTWNYWSPTEEPAPGWKERVFTNENRTQDRGGIGYGDEDDGTTIESTLSVYIHTSFEIKALEEVATAVLLVDYDDGFIAYLNGVEVARSGICSDGIIPAFDNSAEI